MTSTIPTTTTTAATTGTTTGGGGTTTAATTAPVTFATTSGTTSSSSSEENKRRAEATTTTTTTTIATTTTTTTTTGASTIILGTGGSPSTTEVKWGVRVLGTPILYRFGGDDDKNVHSLACALDTTSLRGSSSSSSTTTTTTTTTSTTGTTGGGSSSSGESKAAWVELPPMPTPRSYAAAAMHHDGRIFVTGGYRYSPVEFYSHVDCYSPTLNTWTTMTPMRETRSRHLAIACGGLIYVIGGRVGSGPGAATGEVYDPASNTWRDMPRMSMVRNCVQGCAYGGRLYVFGGSNFDEPKLTHSSFEKSVGTLLRSAEVFDPATNKWSAIAPPLTARGCGRAVAIGDTIVVMGGSVLAVERKITGIQPSVEIYTPSSDSWTAASWALPGRYSQFAAHWTGTHVVVSGGHDGSVNFNNVVAYCIATQTWETWPELPSRLYEAASI